MVDRAQPHVMLPAVVTGEPDLLTINDVPARENIT